MSFDANTIIKASNDAKLRQESSRHMISSLSSKIFDVIIVGGGLTGISIAYHLSKYISNTTTSILLVEQGDYCLGKHDRIKTATTIINEDIGDERSYHPYNSGSVVYSLPHFSNGPKCVKFIVKLYPTTTKNFIKHHGEDGTRTYFEMSSKGIEIEREVCKKVVPKQHINNVLEDVGSLLVCEADDLENLIEEYELLRKLGNNEIEFWNEEKVKSIHGGDSTFVAGIYFPNDSRIDVLTYIHELIKALPQQNITLIDNSPRVINVVNYDKNNDAIVYFDNNVRIHAKQVVLATNALYIDRNLAGILNPCWSYFVSIPHRNTTMMTKSMNFFTYDFTHDWCVCGDGMYRISGEDHYSACKPPRAKTRCESLYKWSCEKYDSLKHEKYEHLYGIYGETPDYIPLVGKVSSSSNVIYAVGCNAWGQATMSYVASLIPGLLGYTRLTPTEERIANFISIQRFTSQQLLISSSL